MDYLGNMRLVVLSDEEFFQIQDWDAGYGKRSRFFTRQIDNAAPSFIDGRYRKNFIEDETSYLQYGQWDENEFFEFAIGQVEPSSWINWPTKEKPNNRYKYASIEFNMSTDQMNWSR